MSKHSKSCSSWIPGLRWRLQNPSHESRNGFKSFTLKKLPLAKMGCFHVKFLKLWKQLANKKRSLLLSHSSCFQQLLEISDSGELGFLICFLYSIIKPCYFFCLHLTSCPCTKFHASYKFAAYGYESMSQQERPFSKFLWPRSSIRDKLDR